MATNETVNIWVKVKGNAEKALKGVSTQLKKNDSQVKKNAISWKSLAVAAGGMVVLTKVNRWMGESIKLAQEQEKAERKLSASLGFTSQALLDYAAALQKKTTFGDEETIASAALVANFVKEEEQIKRIIKVSQDLATAKGMTLANATDLVTKTVASSTNALSRYGIEVEGAAGSIERIDSAVQSLDTAFGGMAEAMALTSEGQITQMENEIGDLREEVGIKLTPAMIKMKQATLDFYNVVLNNTGPAITAVEKIGAALVGAAEAAAWWAGGEEEAELKTLVMNTNEYATAIIALDDAMVDQKASMEANAGRAVSFERAEKNLANLQAEMDHLKELRKEWIATEAAIAKAQTDGRTTALNAAVEALDFNSKAQEDAADDEIEAVDHKYKKIAEKTMTWQEILAESNRQMKFQEGEDNAIAAQAQLDLDVAQQEQRRNMAIDFAQQTANQVSLIMSAVNNRRQQDIDRETKQRKDDVKDSTMSAKQKAKALQKIEEDASKKKHELALKEWKQNLVMSIVNTALGVTKALSSAAPPLNFIMAAATGVTGGVATGIIAANKPKMFNGGELTNTSGMGGDVIPFIGRRGEEVVTPEEKRNMKGGGGNINITAPVINISGNATPEALDRVEEIFNNFPTMVEDMFRNRIINSDIVNEALSR